MGFYSGFKGLTSKQFSHTYSEVLKNYATNTLLPWTSYRLTHMTYGWKMVHIRPPHCHHWPWRIFTIHGLLPSDFCLLGILKKHLPGKPVYNRRWHDARCHLLATGIWHQFPLYHNTSLCAKVGQVCIIHTEKSNKMQQCIKIYYSRFI